MFVSSRIDHLNTERNTASISYQSAVLNIDTTLVPCFDGRKGDIGQFIGDIEDKIMKVKSYKRIDDLDLKLFEQLLAEREKFLLSAVY